MTDFDFKLAMETFTALWPKAGDSLNREQLNVYRMAFGKHTAEQVQAVLRDFAASSEKWPTPAALRARLNGQKKPGAARETGRFDGFRARNVEASDWSDEQCDLAERKWDFEGAARVYGPRGSWTIEYWRRWQATLLHYGHRSEQLAEKRDHAAVIEEYERMGGLAEAESINQARASARA